MQAKYIFLLVIIAAVFLYFVGGLVSDQCTTIGPVKKCWKTTSVIVNSPYCPNANESCLASPEAQQHNALVDLILEACNIARNNGYADDQINSRINQVVSNFTSYNIGAQEICESPGILLTYRNYD